VLLALLRATHPLPAAAVTALVGVLAAVRGADGASLGWAIASTAVGQASVGWSNDFLDRHRDAAAGRIEKALVAGAVGPRVVLIMAVAAGGLSPALSLPLGLPEAVVMLVAVASAWSYNLGLKTTALSWAPYAVSFGLAPVYIWFATGDRPPGWIVLVGVLLGAAAHLVNVFPDLDADRATEVRGLPHRIGLGPSIVLACVIFLGSVVLSLAAAEEGPWSWPAAALAVALIGAVGWSGLIGRTDLSFRLAIASAGAIVLVLVVSPSALLG
jgi:4-hydroxybenzoate polyprenyltransferase